MKHQHNDLTNVLRRSVEIATESGHSRAELCPILIPRICHLIVMVLRKNIIENRQLGGRSCSVMID